MEYDNIGIQIYGWTNYFYVDALTDITKHSLYETVPLVTINGYEYDKAGNRSYRTITINRWLILSIVVPGATGTSAPLNTTNIMSQPLTVSL
jgi:hypothetical protein